MHYIHNCHSIDLFARSMPFSGPRTFKAVAQASAIIADFFEATVTDKIYLKLTVRS